MSSFEERIDHALRIGAVAEAVQLGHAAVQAQPHSWAAFHRFGLALMAAQRVHEAFAQFNQALRLNPLAAEVRTALANAHLLMGDSWTAAAWISDACRLQPNHPTQWIHLVQLLAAHKRDAEIEPALHAAVAANPSHKGLLEMLAEFYLHRKRYAEAAQIYPRLIELDPSDAKNLLHGGYCLEHTNELEASVARYREALALRPDFLEAHVDLAGVLWRLGDFAGSLEHARKAVAIDPKHPFAVRILGTAHLHLNQLDEAEKYLRQALELKPDFPIATIDLALMLLLAGRFEEGWKVYERRWSDTDRMTRPAFFKPELEWKGPELQPVAGKNVVIYAEQGLGDVINFIRYAKVLQKDGAKVFCVIQPDLVPLVETMAEVVCLKPGINIEADYHVALLELPLHYRTHADNVPAEVPYLSANAEKVAAWRERLKPWDGKLKVGIGWAGHQIHANHHNRCMPLSEFLPIIELPGVQTFSLQKSHGGRYTDVAIEEHQLVDFTADLHDFSDSAALVDNLDLIIHIDSAVVHLAGALGKPVWVPLPPNPDWRWLLDRDNSPWYPTMRLFRRSHTEARSAQMARILAELVARREQLLAARSGAF